MTTTFKTLAAATIAGSIAFGWRLPVYRSQPPRPDAPKR